MATPTCAHCGAALPRTALHCPRCGRPAFARSGRRSRRRRDASLLGMVGSLVLAAQSGSMLVGGAIALAALDLAVRGDTGGAVSLAGSAAIFVGFTLLFDLLGVALLAGAFHGHARAIRERGALEDAVARQQLARQGRRAAILLVLWLLVTLAWRGALAALVSFYPTPFGGPLEPPAVADVQLAASVMLGLWVAAALLLFAGALNGMRFLRRLRKAPMTLPRALWPLETLVHFAAAVAILAIAPTVLAQLQRLELGTLRIVQTLAVIDLVLVPVLGVLAYAYLFLEFRRLHRDASLPEPAAAPTVAAAGGEP